MRISTARDTLAGVVMEGLRASVVSDKEPVFEFGICVGFSARSAQLACGGKAGGREKLVKIWKLSQTDAQSVGDG